MGSFNEKSLTYLLWLKLTNERKKYKFYVVNIMKIYFFAGVNDETFLMIQRKRRRRK